MMDLSNLKIGINVDIQRTDGRVHSAVISGLNNETKSVTVEWFERGETKGKEIEAEAIFSLNPHLMEKAAGSRDTHSSQSTRVTQNNVQETPRFSNRAGSARSRQSYAARPPATQQNGQADASEVQAKKPGIPVPDRRKSNCVKEVEKIEQRRKDRRKEQAAIREQQEVEYDLSDPNWQFMAMIKEYRAQLEYRPLTSSDPIENHQICVCVRVRPLNRKGKNFVGKP